MEEKQEQEVGVLGQVVEVVVVAAAAVLEQEEEEERRRLAYRGFYERCGMITDRL